MGNHTSAMNWQLAGVVGLVSTIASLLFGHAWVISDYLIRPGCCSDLLASRRDLPQFSRMIPGDMEAELSLPVEQLSFESQDDPANPSRGASIAGWLIPAEGSDRGGVVLVHDTGADSRQMLSLVTTWNRQGYHCLLLETQEGAAAALFAAQKSMEVDAVVLVDLHAESDPLMQKRADTLLNDIQNIDGTVTGHAKLMAVRSSGFVFLNEDVTSIVSTLASHIAVIRSSSWLTWLHGHSDPLKGIHRLSPRGMLIVQSKQAFGKSTVPIQKLYHRAGQCTPKSANLPEESAHPDDLSTDAQFSKSLSAFLNELD